VNKILLYILLFTLLIAMIIFTLLLPGSLESNQPWFFRYLTIYMVTAGSLWMVKSTFFALLAPWYTYIWERRKRYLARYDYRPLVSVIIPAWNEEVGLVATIKTILASSYRHLEVVVINDGSTDQSDEVMRMFIQKYESIVGNSRHYIPLIYHYQPNGGKGTALNKGLSLSHGEIIVTFDADSAVHEDAIKHFVSYFANPYVMAAAGNIKVGNTGTILGLVQSLEYYFSFQNKKAEALLGIVFVIGGAASAFRREVFNRLGGYNTRTLTEDLDLSLRVQKAGMCVVYAPEAVVHTEGATTLRGLLKQRLRWKRGRLEAFRIHKLSFFSREKGVNKPFFWIILPLVILEDIETILGTAYLTLLYLFSLQVHDFSYFLSIVAITTGIAVVQLSEGRYFRKSYYLLLAPIVWFLLHIKIFVDLTSLMHALYTFYRKREVKWQEWQRTGVADS
jgi:cellulose synthase/poly-beta-1,6-N-acetylglucosamine synthase-like glycosyltransferase